MIETGLRAWLLSQPAVVSQLVGSGTSPVFIEDAPAGSGEYILLSLTDGDYASTIDPDDQAHRDLIDEEMDIDVKCQTAGKSKDVAKLILDAMFPAVGPNYTGTMGDRYAEAIFLEVVKSGYEQPASNEKKGRHVTQITVRIHNRSE